MLKFKICTETRGYLLIGHSNITNHGYKYYQLTLTQKITSNELRVRSAWYTTPPPRPKKLIKNVESDLAPHVYSDQYTQSIHGHLYLRWYTRIGQVWIFQRCQTNDWVTEDLLNTEEGIRVVSVKRHERHLIWRQCWPPDHFR